MGGVVRFIESKEYIIGVILNISICILIRILAGDPPFKINLHKLKEIPYPPHVKSFKHVRILFVLLVLYTGYPAAHYIAHLTSFLLYLMYWCPTVMWWSLFSACYFKSSIALGLITAMYQIFLFDMKLLPLIVWNIFSIYLSLWYKSHVLLDREAAYGRTVSHV